MSRPSQAFIGALANEQFGLQSAAGATISESGSRSGLYFSSLSSGLVAVGFASSSPGALEALSFTVLPTVFILGWFTVVRLVDTSVQNLVALERIEAIRRYWASLDPSGDAFFPSDSTPSGSRGVRYGKASSLFTTATMVAAVNSVLGGAIAVLALVMGAHLGLPGAVPIGLAVGLALLVASLAYQRRRIGTPPSPSRPLAPLEEPLP